MCTFNLSKSNCGERGQRVRGGWKEGGREGKDLQPGKEPLDEKQRDREEANA